MGSGTREEKKGWEGRQGGSQGMREGVGSTMPREKDMPRVLMMPKWVSMRAGGGPVDSFICRSVDF